MGSQPFPGVEGPQVPSEALTHSTVPSHGAQRCSWTQGPPLPELCSAGRGPRSTHCDPRHSASSSCRPGPGPQASNTGNSRVRTQGHPRTLRTSGPPPRVQTVASRPVVREGPVPRCSVETTQGTRLLTVTARGACPWAAAEALEPHWRRLSRHGRLWKAAPDVMAGGGRGEAREVRSCDVTTASGHNSRPRAR